MSQISPKAIVSNPAGLAEDVRVGAFSYLGPNVTVESGTVIFSNVTVLGRTRIGQNCRLFPGCIVACLPLESQGEAEGLCLLETGNTVREHVVIEAGSPSGAGTRLGPNNLLMAGCQVGHDAVLEGEGIFANFTRIEHHACIQRFVRTSAFTNVQPFVTVGAYTITTGYAGIDRDAPPYAMVQGMPFRVRGVNAENLRRCRFSAASIAALKSAFRALFADEQPFPAGEALREVQDRFQDEHVRFLVESLRESAAAPAGRRLSPVVPEQ